MARSTDDGGPSADVRERSLTLIHEEIAMDSKTRREVIDAYNSRGKGSNESTFVDRTRNGHYLEINKVQGSVREISRTEYESSSYARYEDGLARGTTRTTTRPASAYGSKW